MSPENSESVNLRPSLLGTFGLLKPPYPFDHCSMSGCGDWKDDAKVYWFTDHESGKSLLFCEPHAEYIELHRSTEFSRVML